MSRDTLRQPPHVGDDELVRLLDGEAGHEETMRTAAHAESCGECGARLATLRRRSAALGRLIGETDPAIAVPDLSLHELLARRAAAGRATTAARPAAAKRAPWRAPAERPWLRAAAVVALLLGLGLGAPPVRAWVLERLGDAVALLRGDTSPGAAAPSAAAEEDGSALVSFEPTSPTFTVELRHAQRGGRLVVRVGVGRVATAGVVDGGAELLVRPGGLTIGNAPESESSYLVTLPAGLERVVIRLGGREVDAFRPADLAPPFERSFALDRTRE